MANTKKSATVSLAWLHPAVVTGALMPLATLVYLALRRSLGANPVAEALNQLGLIALVLLIASLACTPIRMFSGWNWLFRLRRTLGLLAFMYALLHLLTYAGLDQLGNLRAIWTDVTKRWFIFVGFAAFLCLLPLAFTSTARSVKRIGARNWKRLHRLAYLAGILGVIHYYLRVKSDVQQPVVFGAVLAVLLGVRIARWMRGRSAARSTSRQTAAQSGAA